MLSLPMADDCFRCELRANCESVVWGRGARSADVLFVGESPSQEDELIGEPFAGRPGDLLRKLMASAGLSTDRSFFTLQVKCPCRRGARAGQIKACSEWLSEEIREVNPAVVVALGREPARRILGYKSDFSMEDAAGVFVARPGFWGAAWFGPNFLLQQSRAYCDATVDFFKRVLTKVNDVRVAEEEAGPVVRNPAGPGAGKAA